MTYNQFPSSQPAGPGQNQPNQHGAYLAPPQAGAYPSHPAGSYQPQQPQQGSYPPPQAVAYPPHGQAGVYPPQPGFYPPAGQTGSQPPQYHAAPPQPGYSFTPHAAPHQGWVDPNTGQYNSGSDYSLKSQLMQQQVGLLTNSPDDQKSLSTILNSQLITVEVLQSIINAVNEFYGYGSGTKTLAEFNQYFNQMLQHLNMYHMQGQLNQNDIDHLFTKNCNWTYERLDKRGFFKIAYSLRAAQTFRESYAGSFAHMANFHLMDKLN